MRAVVRDLNVDAGLNPGSDHLIAFLDAAFTRLGATLAMFNLMLTTFLTTGATDFGA